MPEDFLQLFMDHTETVSSPAIFRKWAAIATVAGACERRIWVQTGPLDNFLNLYILLVAAPGVGKGIINSVAELWSKAVEPGSKMPCFQVAPLSMTKASLMDRLDEAKRTLLTPQGKSYTFSTLQIAAEEFSVLLPSYDMEYIGNLNQIWNNPQVYSETRRHNVKKLNIEHPQLNIIGGVQPAFIASSFPEDAWKTGLARRMLMIYSGQGVPIDWALPRGQLVPTELLQWLGRLSKRYGALLWEAEVFDEFVLRYKDGFIPRPQHSKLEHYLTTRHQYVIKLAGISAIMRSQTAIGLADLDRAQAWLFEAERYMPDIFRAMLGRNDHAVMEELRLAMVQFKMREKQEVPGDFLWLFLHDRVPNEKILYILQTMEKAAIIQRVEGMNDKWQVNPKFLRKIE